MLQTGYIKTLSDLKALTSDQRGNDYARLVKLPNNRYRWFIFSEESIEGADDINVVMPDDYPDSGRWIGEGLDTPHIKTLSDLKALTSDQRGNGYARLVKFPNNRYRWFIFSEESIEDADDINVVMPDDYPELGRWIGEGLNTLHIKTLSDLKALTSDQRGNDYARLVKLPNNRYRWFIFSEESIEDADDINVVMPDDYPELGRWIGEGLNATQAETGFIYKSSDYDVAAGDRILVQYGSISSYTLTLPVYPNDGDVVEILAIDNYSILNVIINLNEQQYNLNVPLNGISVGRINGIFYRGGKLIFSSSLGWLDYPGFTNSFLFSFS